MKLTVIPVDSNVTIDGKTLEIDVSSLSSGIHAIQWYDTWGEIEWKDERGKMVRNEEIYSIEDYQWIIDAWNEKNNQTLT